MPNLYTPRKRETNAMPRVAAFESEAAPAHTLRADNQRLRELVVSLSASLLRNVVRDFPRDRRDATRNTDAEHLFYEAEVCFVCARISGLKEEIAEGLEAAGHEFMAKAVEIETRLQREKWKNNGRPSA
jgi:hypothetical protein